MVDKKAEIFQCAKELFSEKGFKDTNVSDITKLAGMAVGTFYSYYPSKEKLFLDIYMKENVKLKRYIMETVDPNVKPLELMKEAIRLNIEGMNANPILREWFNRDVFSKIERLFHEENGLDEVSFMFSGFVELVQKWQAEGKMRNDIDSEFIMAMFGAIINMDMHKEEIGVKYFPQLMDYMAEFVMNGLTEPLNSNVK